MNEAEAYQQVLELAEAHGYGNLIAFLQAVWAQKLVKNYNMSEDDAIAAVIIRQPYSIEFADNLLKWKTDN